MSSLVEDATIKIRRDSASNWTSNNPTPASGEWCIETDTGQVKIGDGSTAWNAKGYHIKNPESIDISSSNQVYNLPAVKGGQKEVIKWSGGDGTYKLTFTTQGLDTMGGLAASVWEGEGEGIIVLSDDGGTDWVVEEYEDYISGSTGEAIKKADGTLRQWFTDSTTYTTTNTSGALYQNTANIALTFPVAFVGSFPLVTPSCVAVFGAPWGRNGAQSLTVANGRIMATANTGQGKFSYDAIGSWK